MAILSECPICRRKQSIRNKVCNCGENLDRAKKSKRVRYWISFRFPGGKQRREFVGDSIEEARAADGKRRGQKRENRIFDMLPESKITFNELSEWYMGLKSVKGLSSFDREKTCLKNFNSMFGQQMVNTIKQTELENYQDKRKGEGRAVATIDMEIKIAQTAVTKAFDNDMIDGRALKAFRKTNRLLETGSNARRQLISMEQFLDLIEKAPHHYQAVLVIAFYTGMRLGEIRQLRWQFIETKNNMISLPKEITKEGRPKRIPINHHVKSALDSLPKALHHDYVITYKGMPMNGKNSLKKQFEDACIRVKIPYGRNNQNGITFHDIRRTFKTNLAEAGVEKVYRDTLLGHSLKGMDAHYIVPTDKALTNVMERYTRWIDQKFLIVDQTVDQMAAQN